MLKLFYYHQKLCGNLSSNFRVGCLTSRVEKTQKMTKIFKKVEKICKFFEKNAKFRNVEMLKPFYYHYKLHKKLLSNHRVGWLTSGVDKTQKMTIIFKKVWKTCKFIQKNAKFSNVEMLKPFYYH